jgi:hypothetical protein
LDDDKVGFVYVLEVKDIALPVCKIGMTRRQPEQRLTEINRSSTGDFLWKLHSAIRVSDCGLLESRAHRDLAALRQQGRELFGLSPAGGAERVQRIAEVSSDLDLLPTADPVKPPKPPRPTKPPSGGLSKRHLEYANLLDAFNVVFGCTGRPFGQLSRPVLGMSDGVSGVQWNLAVYTDEDRVQLGVNLEGMKYTNWPISDLIRSELEQPGLVELSSKTRDPESILVHFRRDAWQAASRPMIREGSLGRTPIALSELSAEIWRETVEEARDCLDSERNHRARAKAVVTRVAAKTGEERRQEMEVSPHLVISSAVNREEDPVEAIRRTRALLEPVYDWAVGRAG